jgi:choline dehydrogenase-like flavoprotein
MQIKQTPTVYDVCIIGSGAGGGAAAYVLTKAGASVVMLEAGPDWDSSRDSAMFKWPFDSPRRGAATRERSFGEFDGCIGAWEIDGEPYTTPEGERFDWYRARMLGGRTNHWGRISLRMGPDDFRRKTLDGLGEDWPITYDDLKPYYDDLDRFVGLFGSNEGIPNEPDGIFLPPPAPRCYERLIKQASEKVGIPCIPNRLSIITQPHNGRPQCHYCGQCGRGCSTHSNFSSTSVFLPPALATGKLKIITGAMAREVLTDTNGMATGVSYVNTADAREFSIRAKAVVLAGSAGESARLMFNSKSARHPSGLSNSSGVLGKYLTDSTGLSVSGFIPKMLDMPAHNEDGAGGAHLYMPWWLDGKKLDFPRGYHIEIGGGRRMPGYGFGGGTPYLPGSNGGGYGRALKDDYRKYYGGVERGLLLRDRPEYGRQVGHSGAALSLEVERARAQPGEAHAGDLPRDHPRDGRDAARDDAGTGSRLRPRGGRAHHSRGRLHAHGEGPADVGAERVVPGARGEKRRRLRRRPVCQQRPQELHVDHHGAVVADQSASGG